ncbi:hypothetical protein HAP48_0035095 [Bradyrhizobium septentrionale]|uniref:Uncharacterized protein n=1 Tax=Bradyrhizobium septentrionale TaxID=1404411 RepID=A0A974A1H7_9BRAD|nr:hypothetical protein [Bradyrhizobium septentrionale]UGY13761.1 hypothetical protein HAP48_0035095 [Bradyrhizobium septentrionale]
MKKLLLGLLGAVALTQGAEAATADIYGVAACYTYKDPAYENGCSLDAVRKNPTFASEEDCKGYVAGANQQPRNQGGAMTVTFICVKRTISAWEQVR